VEFEEMNKNLEAPRKKLKQQTAEIKGATDPEKKQTLKAEESAIIGQVDAIVMEYVPEKNIQNLTYRFNKTQSQWIFSVGLAFFAIVMVLAGRMMPKIGPRNLAALGGVVLGAGYVLAGLVGGHDFMKHLLFIGVIGGSGIGLAYVVPIAVAMRWFPDKKGLITGLTVAGFGFGAMGWVKIAGAWFGLIALWGLSTVFVIYGVAFFVIVGIGSIWMVFPPEDWGPEGWVPPASKSTSNQPAGRHWVAVIHSAAGSASCQPGPGEDESTPQRYESNPPASRRLANVTEAHEKRPDSLPQSRSVQLKRHLA
jgi:MFS family permease